MFNTKPNFTGRQIEALQQAQEHWRKLHAREAAAGPSARAAGLTIAITREAGCPGTTVAQEVGARLGWPVYDHELLELIAKETGLRVNLLESVDERRQSWVYECLQSLGTGAYVSEGTYVHHLVQTVLSLGAHGECVIVGRGAAQLLPAGTTLRVRLVGDLKDRIPALAARLGLSLPEAERKVEETDRERSRFIKNHFHKDPTDLRQYDLILNTSRWPVAACAELIAHAARLCPGQAV